MSLEYLLRQGEIRFTAELLEAIRPFIIENDILRSRIDRALRVRDIASMREARDMFQRLPQETRGFISNKLLKTYTRPDRVIPIKPAS